VQKETGTGDVPPLVCEHLTKRYGDVVAVRDVSLTVARGEVVGLIGPNGAGKSTLLSMLAGLLVPDEGTAEIDGVRADSPGGIARRRLGFVAGDTRLYARLTVREVLRFYGALHGLSGATLDDAVQKTADELSLAPLFDRRCDALSSGQEQRTNLARALVHDPAILILDEPTTALDVASQRFVLEVIERARRTGRAVLLASHVMGEVERVADRVIVLDGGTIRAEGTLAALLDEAGGRGLGAFFTDGAAL
jgi:sodium transport system ATP-binding protein